MRVYVCVCVRACNVQEVGAQTLGLMGCPLSES